MTRAAEGIASSNRLNSAAVSTLIEQDLRVKGMLQAGMKTPLDDSGDDRIIVVRPRAFGGNVADELALRYPRRGVLGLDSFLSAISSVGRNGCDAVLACVDAAEPRVEEAVAGLRRAAGVDARIVLCCKPEGEPIARRVLHAGANEYVLHPLQGPELDAALGIAPQITWQGGRLTPATSATLEELEHLGRLLANLGGRPRALMTELAGIVRLALSARGVRLVLQDRAASAGEDVREPVLTCPIADSADVPRPLDAPQRIHADRTDVMEDDPAGRMDAEPLGRFDVGPRDRGAYSLADVEKLQHYARLAGHVLRAARRQRRWRKLAETDELTGLPNRRAFLHAFALLLQRARTEHFPVTVLMFDLDDFKAYNDACGHDVGDEILRTTARLFRKHCREHDLIARLGGDEFAVVFHDPQGPRVAGSKHPETVLAVLERFREALRRQVFEPLGAAGQGRLTISGGLAAFPWDGAAPDTLLHRADQALLEAKRAGKNRIVLVGNPDHGSPGA
ncbi:MAG: GGDEF domain-containing protein [Phycisphaerales bacterium]|nr:GGDEF domain-containing protein [Phycisphaerales bacterium]